MKNEATLQHTIDLLSDDHEHLYCVFSNVTNHFVVVDSNNDQFYSVQKDSEGNAKVHTGYRPYLFNGVHDALYVAEGFRARNGKGPITWKVMSAAEYYDLMQPKLAQMMADLRLMMPVKP